MRAGRNGPLIPHLMFADDLLLFSEATKEQMGGVLNILNDFCQLSGQQVSHEKTSIMFSKNVSSQVRGELVALSGFCEASSLEKYLGVSILGRAPKRADYNYLINQVKNRLSSWKAKQLSFAGRVTLAKAVIKAIPIYPMMTTSVPKSCLNEIQKIQRAFIWGDEEGHRKYHAVSWDNVTLQKARGGLGIRRLIHMNKACLMKLGWVIRSGEEAMWIDVMRGNYGREHPNFEYVVAKSQDSSLWKNLVTNWNSFDLYEFWAIGNGSSIHAWKDRWLQHGQSIEESGIVIPDNMKNMMVCDLVDEQGCWNIDMLNTWLPNTIISKLYAVIPPNNGSDKDRRVWSGTDNGCFSIASAYMLLCRFNDDSWDTTWMRIWRLKVPERI